MTPCVVTGDFISENTWYFHRTTAKQGGVCHFGKPGCLECGSHCYLVDRSLANERTSQSLITTHDSTRHKT